MTRRSALGQVAIFALSFLAVSQALLRFGPADDGRDLSFRLHAIETEPRPFTAIFIGNSHVYRHVDPAAFDAVVAERLPEFRSYNLGAKGMSLFEAHYLLRRLFASSPDRLRWVFVDLTLRLDSHPDNFESQRVINWHVPSEALMAVSWVLGRQTPIGEKLDSLARHARATLRRMSNQGRLTTLVSRSLSHRTGLPSADRLEAASRGHLPVDRFDTPHKSERRGKLVAADEDREERLDALPPSDGLPPEAIADDQRLLRAIVELVVANGARPVFYVSPTIYWPRLVPDDGECNGYPVLAFNDPARYPQLYDAKVRFDPDHLNKKGAETFTRLLAERFLRSLDGGDGE